jgi:hypothetical protein
MTTLQSYPRDLPPVGGRAAADTHTSGISLILRPSAPVFSPSREILPDKGFPDKGLSRVLEPMMTLSSENAGPR